MRTSHENHSILKGLKIMCEERTINLSSAKQIIPFKMQVQAIYIIVGASQAVDARDRHNRVFGSRNEGDYPQGIKLRFVPDIADARFPATPNTRMKAVKMMSKQKAFITNTKLIPAATIAGLHMVLEKAGGYSLCQTLMAIRSADDAEMGLFISIDKKQIDGSCTTIFTAHNDRCEEACGLIPLFCVMFEVKFGIVAREWFTEESKVIHSKYKWDHLEGQVVPLAPEDDEEGFDLDSDDEFFTAISDSLNIDASGTAKKGFVFDIDYLIDDVAPSKNQHGDSGSVNTFRDACIEILESELDDESDADISKEADQRSPSPDSMTIQADSATLATSNLTEDTTSDVAASLEQLMLKNPELAQQFFHKNAQLLSKTAAVSPTDGADPGN
jgi:hypothetical protein